MLADITGRDSDGELLARPTEWDEDENGEPPKFASPPRAAPGRAKSPASATARCCASSGHRDGETSGRVIKVIDHAKNRVLGIFRGLPTAADGWSRSTRSRPAANSNIATTDTGGAEDGDLVSVDVRALGGFGLACRQGQGAARLAHERESGQPDRDPRPRHSASVFAPAALREAEEAQPATLKGREDWRDVPFVTIDPPDAKDHDDAVHATPDPDPQQQGRLSSSPSRSPTSRFYVRPGSALDRDALTRGNSVYFPDRVVPMLPERISNDLCSLVRARTAPALAVRMVIGADGRKRSHTLSSRADPLGGAS